MPSIVAVSRQQSHLVTKDIVESVELVAGYGIVGDAHFGETTKHRYSARRHPSAPNLRQVHLIQAELFDELASKGFDVGPGLMGENITTEGVDLLALSTGTKLVLGGTAVVELTGLRSPCVLLDRLRPGLKTAVLDRDPHGKLIRKAGVMSIVLTGGTARAGDSIEIILPSQPHYPLEPVE
jgi:MOSC domain-containing protein YiiM